jgi:23S rRNA (adenine1618-N6)-methyltransferase
MRTPSDGGPAAAGDVLGLDIGCGANLIYPLLGAAQHGWRFVAADITDAAISGAAANLAANPHLAHLIQVQNVAVTA